MRCWIFGFLISILLISFLRVGEVNAQENMRGEQFEGVVQQVLVLSPEGTQNRQTVEVLVQNGRLENQTVAVTDEGSFLRKFNNGDRIILGVSKGLDGRDNFYIADYVRRVPLYLLFGIFVGLVLLVAGKKGAYSLIGMAATFGVIFFFVLPLISSGYNPVLVAIVSSIFIVPLTFYSSHGFDRKTSAAVIGTFTALLITGILAIIFVEGAKLSGFAAEEAAFVKAAKGDLINIKGLLLAGVMIGILGVLDDITVAQANVVYQLQKAAKHLTFRQLNSSAMEVGKDHIASMVNTLILVYTGAALPLLLLFIDNSAPFSEVINYEIVAEEVVRTLIASIGLILAVPITTYITAWMIAKKND